MDEKNAKTFLRSLPSGRHYGSSSDESCWAMVGRDYRDLSQWEIVTPASSFTFVWGNGGCEIEHENGMFSLGPGDCMWIDAGTFHRGKNYNGSDFATVFFSEQHTRSACLHLIPIGIQNMKAPKKIGAAFTCLAASLVDKKTTPNFEVPIVNAVLDFVGKEFGPPPMSRDKRDLESVIQDGLRESYQEPTHIAQIAESLGISLSKLSRRFKKRYLVSPRAYRKQLRLAEATRLVTSGMPLSEAAHQAGFSDLAHFSRAFKSQYDIAPSIWAEHVADTSQ